MALPMDCLLYQKPQVRYYSFVHFCHIEFGGFFPFLTLKPYRIILYKDDASESQLNQVLMHEMDSIRKVCASLEDRCC